MSGVAEEEGDDGQGDLLDVLPAGTTLPGYELKSLLGHGAFGITYLARGLTLDRDVAIKEYLPTNLAVRRGRTTVRPRSAAHAEQFAWGRERFLDEARTLARLDRTPAIVRVYDFLEANGTAYMVMALIEGENLNRRVMREGRLTPEAVERLLFPLLDGLEEVHAIGFLHRDIKPANIMVDARGRPTLIDFGAARAAMAGRSTTMTAIFTPGYAAAEQYASAELGPWTDIYGLSATLYHAITGKIPPSSIDRILNDTYEPLSELKPEGYAPELLAGIDAGLVTHVAQRPQSIAEWRHVLRTGERQLSPLAATHVELKPRRRGRRSGVVLPRPVLWGATAAAALVLAGAGYLAFTAGTPTTVNTAALSLSAEQLEQALAERRKADTFAAEKRKLEEEARQKAEAETEAKRQADSELEQARQARQKAEQELAELKARIEAQRQTEPVQRDQAAAASQREAEETAQRKAEADAAALRQAEEDARRKVEADTEAKRQADEALARAEGERQRAEQVAHAKAEAEQAALRQSSDDAQRKAVEAESVQQAEAARAKAEAERQKAEADRQRAESEAKVRAEAETSERGLRLEQADRQRLQVALTSLGFDTRGTDGIFGPRSREMIAAWQKVRKEPPTGFLTSAQREGLAKEAAAALSKFDQQKKAEEEAKARLAIASPAPTPGDTMALTRDDAPAQPSAAAPSSATAYDGTYSATLTQQGPSFRAELTLRVANGRGSLTLTSAGCSPSHFSITVSPTGSVTGEGDLNCVLQQNATITPGAFKLDGEFSGRELRLWFRSSRNSFAAHFRPASSQAAAAPRALPSPDGLWRGTYACGPSATTSGWPFTLPLQMLFADGSGSASFRQDDSNGNTAKLVVSVGPAGVTITRSQIRTPVSEVTLSGTYDGSAIRASGIETGSARRTCTLALTRDGSPVAGVASSAPAAAAATQPALPAVAPSQSRTAFDGTYAGGVSGGRATRAMRLQIAGSRGSGTIDVAGCGASEFHLAISSVGEVTGQGVSCQTGLPYSVRGRVEGERLILSFDQAGPYEGARAYLTRQ